MPQNVATSPLLTNMSHLRTHTHKYTTIYEYVGTHHSCRDFDNAPTVNANADVAGYVAGRA